MKKTSWQSGNILRFSGDSQRLWHYQARARQVHVAQDLTLEKGQLIPNKLVQREWIHLLKNRINIAWIPLNKVFLKVIQLPACEPSEINSMVEFQLEKISPIPISQLLWSAEPFPHLEGDLQTIVVCMAERDDVEEIVGNLDTLGFKADCLEAPFVRYLASHKPEQDGLWVYPNADNIPGLCVSVWWLNGGLKHLSFFQSPDIENAPAKLCKSLSQTAWSGQLEGWLTTSIPPIHLVTSDQDTPPWQQALSEWKKEPVQIEQPVDEASLAMDSMATLVNHPHRHNMMPEEFSNRYHQEFVDGLWMRGLSAILMLYIAGVVVYFAALQVLVFQKVRVENKIAPLEAPYKEALGLEEQVDILKDQLRLKFAALDCFLVASQNLPEELSLISINFNRGRTFSIFGTGPVDNPEAIVEYNQRLADAEVQLGDTEETRKLFVNVSPPSSQIRRSPTGQEVAWNFTCDLYNE